MASSILTGSIEGIADSTGRFPLASGVVEAICDFRLEGTLPGVETEAPEDIGDADGNTVAGGSECGGCAAAGAGPDDGVEIGKFELGEAELGGVEIGNAEAGNAEVPPPAAPLAGCTVTGVGWGT